MTRLSNQHPNVNICVPQNSSVGRHNYLFMSRPLLNKILTNKNSHPIRTSTIAKLLKCSIQYAHYIIKKWGSKGWCAISKISHGYLITRVIHRPIVNHSESIIKQNTYNKNNIRKLHCRKNNFVKAKVFLDARREPEEIKEWLLRMVWTGRGKYFKQFGKILTGLEFYKQSLLESRSQIGQLMGKLLYRSKRMKRHGQYNHKRAQALRRAC